MRDKLVLFLFMTMSFCWAGAAVMTACDSGETPKMTKEDLKGRLGDPEVVVVDVRAGGSWTDSATKIKGAVREDPTAVQNWVEKYPKDKTLVFYCS